MSVVACTTCLLCRIQERVVGIPASVVVRVCDYPVEPAFPCCAAWVGGFADMDDDGPLISLRLLGCAGRERRSCRGVLVAEAGTHLLVEIDAVLQLADLEDDAARSVTGFLVPASWLMPCRGHEAIRLDTAAMFRGYAAGAVA